MIDVFTEQHEVLIKTGIANLYWFRGDLKKAWLRAGVPLSTCNHIESLTNDVGRSLTKRQMMDKLYEDLRTADFNLRLRISREFVRFLVEHKNFVPQDDRHCIAEAERAALKLREVVAEQALAYERQSQIRREAAVKREKTYEELLTPIRIEFERMQSLSPQERGYALEKLLTNLIHASKLPVQEPFRAVGEQLDGALKYEGTYYIVELKWYATKLQPAEVGSFYFKVEGRMGARGICIAMNGFTDSVLETLPRGKDLKVFLLDGNHLANVIYGQYTFVDLLEHAIRHATLLGQLYCPHKIERAS